MKKILMFSHNPLRDMMCDSMLEQELIAKGNMVWNRNFLDHDFDAICKIKPDIIILPEIRVEYSHIMARLFKSWGGKVVVRMCEMGVTKKALPVITDAYRNAIYGNIETNDLIELVLAFGEPQKKLYCKYSGVSADKVHAIGAIPFDPVFTNLPPAPKKPKPTILFATGFSYADRNPQYALPEGKSGESLHAEKVEVCRRGRAYWLQTIPVLYTLYGDKYDFVVRPHAGEKADSYNELLSRCAKVNNGSAGTLALDRCDILVHAGSTMGIEAHLTNKPGICMRPVSQDPVVTALHPDGSTLDGFCNAMDKLVLGESNANKRAAKELSSYYEPLDGKACVRAAELITNIETGKTTIPKEWPKFTKPLFTDDPEVLTHVGAWFCAGCLNTYHVTNLHREMCKCPYCGIANVRTKQATAQGGPLAPR